MIFQFSSDLKKSLKSAIFLLIGNYPPLPIWRFEKAPFWNSLYLLSWCLVGVDPCGAMVFRFSGLYCQKKQAGRIRGKAYQLVPIDLIDLPLENLREVPFSAQLFSIAAVHLPRHPDLGLEYNLPWGTRSYVGVVGSHTK